LFRGFAVFPLHAWLACIDLENFRKERLFGTAGEQSYRRIKLPTPKVETNRSWFHNN